MPFFPPPSPCPHLPLPCFSALDDEARAERERLGAHDSRDATSQPDTDDGHEVESPAAAAAAAAAAANAAQPHLLGAEGSLKVLDKDMPRTFNNLGVFRKGGPLEVPLRDVLEAYIFYRPDVGYVQVLAAGLTMW